MDNPQLEDGYTRIANEIIEQLAQVQLAGHETRVLMVIWRKTYGWKKKIDMIALSQFEKITGLPKVKCSEALTRLSDRNIITKKVPENGNRNVITYGFNKCFSQWIRVPENEKRGFPKTGTTKETTTKETRQKKLDPTSHEVRISEFLLFKIIEIYPNFKKPRDIQKWAEVIDRTRRLDGRSFKDLEETIEWLYGPNLQNNSFQFVVQSPESLRKKFDAIQVQMNKGEPKSKNDQEFMGSLKSMGEFVHEEDFRNGKPYHNHTPTEPIAGLIEPLVIDV